MLPGEIDFGVEAVRLDTRVTRGITLRTPFVSSPMDTVTESAMAIGMAQHGGLGVIHYNMPIEDQVAEVRKVKTYKNGFISDPVVLSPDASLAELDDVKEKYGHYGIPITADGKLHSKLVGIVTKRDVDLVEDRSGAPGRASVGPGFAVSPSKRRCCNHIIEHGRFASPTSGVSAAGRPESRPS